MDIAEAIWFWMEVDKYCVSPFL